VWAAGTPGAGPPCEGEILRGKVAAHYEVYGLTAMSCAQTSELIKMLFGMWTWVGPKKHVLDGGSLWHHLMNMIEPSMCGSDAAFLSNYFDHLLLVLFNCQCRSAERNTKPLPIQRLFFING